MTVTFQRATKKQAKLRMAIDGPSGSGKTYTSLVAAFALADTGKVALIDTEHGSASKYADLFPGFDVLELSQFHPQQYIDGINAAEAAGYEVIVIDSLSHAWEGVGGVLDLHDQATKRSQSGNSFTAWKDITPIQRKLVEAMLQSSCHIVATMRSKMEYIQTTDEKGRSVIKKVGMAPVQRQGMEYEFDVFADMDLEHNLVISKSRCHLITDAIVNKPAAAWFATLKGWLSDGAAPAAAATQPTASAATAVPAAPGTTATAAATQPAQASGPKHPKPAADANRGAKLMWIMDGFKALAWNINHQRSWLKKQFGVLAASDLQNGRLDEAIDMLYNEINPPMVQVPPPAAPLATTVAEEWEKIAGEAAQERAQAGAQ